MDTAQLAHATYYGVFNVIYHAGSSAWFIQHEACRTRDQLLDLRPCLVEESAVYDTISQRQSGHCTIIIIIIAPLTIVSKDQWGNLECLYKACQAAITEGGVFTDTG